MRKMRKTALTGLPSQPIVRSAKVDPSKVTVISDGLGPDAAWRESGASKAVDVRVLSRFWQKPSRVLIQRA